LPLPFPLPLPLTEVHLVLRLASGHLRGQGRTAHRQGGGLTPPSANWVWVHGARGMEGPRGARRSCGGLVVVVVVVGLGPGPGALA
jgi:hypothetical protein